jgi:hypothetical protein
MGTTGLPETSVRNYHYSLRNNPEECSYHVYVFLIHVLLTKVAILSVRVLKKTNTTPSTYAEKHELRIKVCNANVFIVFNVGVYIIVCFHCVRINMYLTFEAGYTL